MRIEDDDMPEELPSIGQILAGIACVIAVATSGVLSILFAINGDIAFVFPVIQLLGSLVCLWAVIFYKVPDVQDDNVAQRMEYLSELHSEGLINENDYERKKREILGEV